MIQHACFSEIGMCARKFKPCEIRADARAGKPCWMGYAQDVWKSADNKCPVVDIPTEYRGQIMRSRVVMRANVQIRDAGTGYKAGDTITIINPNGVDSKLYVASVTGKNGAVETVELTSYGSGYDENAIYHTITTGKGQGATFTMSKPTVQCAKTVESRSQCNNVCETDEGSACSYDAPELDPYTIVSPTEGIPIESTMLSNVEGHMYHKGGVNHPLATCDDPFQAGKHQSCKRAFDFTRMGPLDNGFTLNDLDTNIKIVGYDVGQKTDCGSFSTEDSCVGSCRWNAGVCESTLRREATPTDIKCSLRLDDHTFLFKTAAPIAKGDVEKGAKTQLVLPESGVFDAVVATKSTFSKNVPDESKNVGERCTAASQCISGRCDLTGDYSCFGRCIAKDAQTTYTSLKNCPVPKASTASDLECEDQLRLIAETIRPPDAVTGYSRYKHQRPKKQPVGALCGHDMH